jgi:hypothetical protein
MLRDLEIVGAHRIITGGSSGTVTLAIILPSSTTISLTDPGATKVI